MTVTGAIRKRIGPAWSLVLVLVPAAGIGAAACGTQNGVMTPAGTGKGYPARSPVVTTAPARPAVAPPPPAPPVAAAPIATPSPPPPPPAPRVYEPPMPLEPSQSRSVAAAAMAPNGPNTTAAGLRFAVRGVDPSDVLNMRSGPSPKHDVVGTIPPDASGVIPVGGRRQIGPAVWREVSYRGVRGWVNDRFLVEEQSANRDR